MYGKLFDIVSYKKKSDHTTTLKSIVFEPQFITYHTSLVGRYHGNTCLYIYIITAFPLSKICSNCIMGKRETTQNIKTIKLGLSFQQGFNNIANL